MFWICFYTYGYFSSKQNIILSRGSVQSITAIYKYILYKRLLQTLSPCDNNV